MAAIPVIPFLSLLSCNLPSSTDYQSKLQPSMFSLLFCLFFFAFSFISLSSLILSFYKKLRKTEQQGSTTIFQCSVDKTQDRHESKLTQLARSLLLEISPANSPKWATMFNGEGCDQQVPDCQGFDGERVDSGEEDCGKKKKKKRTKKKRSNSKANDCGEKRRVATEGLEAKEKQELVCLYPFTSSSSATQRKIKQQYDQLVKSHESNGLTLAQVGQFVNCLIEARNELQHKSEVIQRKFTITKALLCKADRSSFDRLRQQIYKLELEQKRLEEDAFVYNWLQQQLKLSPAYKKMLEIGACTESKANSGERELTESSDTEFAEISFEELLAQEKKDSFWQRNGKHKAC